MEVGNLKQAQASAISHSEPRFGREVYLNLRTALIAEMRCGTNWLRIDMGRRWAKRCKIVSAYAGQVDDERHLLLHCDKYSDLRSGVRGIENRRAVAFIRAAFKIRAGCLGSWKLGQNTQP